MRIALACLLVSASCLAAEDNVLSAEEKKQGWVLLFDGKTMNNWNDPAKKNVPGNAWKVEDGTLSTNKSPKIEEDLVSAKSYGDFELKFDWKVSPGGNTGLKYRIQKEIFVDNTRNPRAPGTFEQQMGRELTEGKSDRTKLAADAKGQVYTVAFEFQLIDDERHADAKRGPTRQTGALYAAIPARTKAAKPAGEWNTAMLKVQGQNFEHWVNGTKVLEGTLKDPAVREGAEKRWGQPAPAIRDMLVNPKPNGPFSLQHHGDPVWFKNIKIRELR
jgi:hypothetical protein